MYKYEDLKPTIFSEEGQRKFLTVRDHIKSQLKSSGAITMGAAIRCVCGDSWESMACVDRLVELGEIREVLQDSHVAGQNRIFCK